MRPILRTPFTQSGCKLQSSVIIVRMRPTNVTILITICVSLLFIQFNGLHQHLDINDSDAAIHGTHVHGVTPDSHGVSPDTHDHSEEVDASFFELGVGWSKIMPFLIMLVLSVLVISMTACSVIFSYCHFLSLRRRSRWRPPLRAPPLPI